VKVALRILNGATVGVGTPRELQGGLIVEAAIPPLRVGVYLVSWEVTAQDGHVSFGEFGFAVGGSGGVPGVVAESGGIAWAQAGAGWIYLLGLLLAFGALASELAIWNPLSRRHRVSIPALPVTWLLALAFLGSLVRIAFLALDARGTGSSGGGSLLATEPGLLAFVQAGAVAYGLSLVVREASRPAALIPLGGALVAAAASGHAATAAWWAVPVDAVHLAAVGLWTGGLAHVVVVAWRIRGEAPGLIWEGIRRYSAIALGVVGVILATGLGVALTQFAHLTELFSTTYGRVLLIKSLLVASALVVAFGARRRALRANPHPHVGLLRRLTRIEAGFVIAALAVSSVLANTAPPAPSTPVSAVIGPAPLREPVLRLAGLTGPLAVHLAAARGRVQVQVLQPLGNPAAASIHVQGRTPDGTEFTLAPRGCGPGCITSAFPWPSGSTQLDVTVRSKRWGGGRVDFSVPWPPEAEDPALLRKAIATMQAQPRLRFMERVSSGPGHASEHSFSTSGRAFMSRELYVSGGVTDVRPLPGRGEARRLTLFLPGSSIWYLLVLDRADRILRETIVSPGHLIQRRFTYAPSSH